MFKKVIWATDGSEASERALPIAVDFVRNGDGKLFVVHADEILTGRAGGFSMFADEDELRDALRAKVAELVSARIDAEFQVVKGVNQDPADLVSRAARKVGADVIVVGTRGHGRVAGMLLGSVTQRLLHVAPCPVLAVPVHARVHSVPEKVAAGAK